MCHRIHNTLLAAFSLLWLFALQHDDDDHAKRVSHVIVETESESAVHGAAPCATSRTNPPSYCAAACCLCYMLRGDCSGLSVRLSVSAQIVR